MNCPICDRRLYVAADPDYGHCLIHGDRPLFKPMGFPLAERKNFAEKPRGKDVYQQREEALR